MGGTTEIWARFARRLAADFEKLADELLATMEEGDAIIAEPAAISEEDVPGSRQRQIVGVAGLATEEGMKTSDVAREIDYEVPNTYMTLQALVGRGVIEQIPGATPQRWRLHRRYRENASPYLRMAAHVRSGEWTTYGDISIAVRGDTYAARAVGRAAAMLDEFPNAHRVLAQGGVIPSGWRTKQGQGPEECERRLREEGVIVEDGRADIQRRITWDQLVERDEAESD